jgi:radical SAM superfamily enzyme YgiQ (UPF0313 family)
MTFNDAARVIKDVKKIAPRTVTVMGGPHVTFCAPQTLESMAELDAIGIGEGEATVVELARAIDDGRDWGEIKGLAYRRGGRVHVTEGRAALDVDGLPPPARHLLPLGRYRALGMPISMTTSRGCPFKCIFCSGRRMVGAKIRYRNPTAVVDEMQYLAGLDFRRINIADDLFTAKRSHAMAVCDEILKRGLDVDWTCFARADTVSPPLLARMKEAGCSTLSFGIETGNPEMLEAVKKRLTVPGIVKGVKMAVASGIDTHVSFILGLPGETPATLQETRDFAKHLQQLGASYGFHLLSPFPGTAVHDEREKFDLKILSDNWSDYHANRAIVETSSVSREMLDEVVEQWNKEFVDSLLEEGSDPANGGVDVCEDNRLSNLHRVLFYHELMMDRGIEERGCWRNGSRAVSAAESLGLLASRLAGTAGKGEEEAGGILSYAHERGYLGFKQSGNEVRWAWNDYL